MSDLSNRSDQWDIRINLPSRKWLDAFIDELEIYCTTGSVRYLHVSGIELGDNPDFDSYGVEHVHIALVLHNYTSKRSVVRRFAPKDQGWYIEARDKLKSLGGWYNYHTKTKTKVDGRLILFKYGEMPLDRPKRTPTQLSERDQAKKKAKFDDWERKKFLMKGMKWDLLDEEFPGFIYSSMGQSMKRELMKQSNDEYTRPLNGRLNNYIIWGPSGSGKSSSVALLFPNCYKKQKGSQYWDSYDKTDPNHSVVWIDEMSKETLKTMTGKMDGGF